MVLHIHYSFSSSSKIPVQTSALTGMVGLRRASSVEHKLPAKQDM